MVVKKTVNKSGFGMRNLWQLLQGKHLSESSFHAPKTTVVHLENTTIGGPMS